jgi:hypothetical protein
MSVRVESGSSHDQVKDRIADQVKDRIADRVKDQIADRVYKVGRRPDEADSQSG